MRFSTAGVPGETRTACPGRTETLVLIAVIVAASLCYLWLALSMADGTYLPVSSDEVGYYSRARAFYENGSLTGPFMLEENVSRVGQFSSHGFSYNLFHGLIAKLVGFHPLNAIITNMVFLLLALGLIALQRLPLAQRLFLLAATLLYFTAPLYLFTYMQEAMHLLFGVCAGALLLAAYRAEEASRRRLYVVPVSYTHLRAHET